MKPNTKFDFTVKELAIVEAALIAYQKQGNPKEIQKLLGKIHEQKHWYRPKGIYVSG